MTTPTIKVVETLKRRVAAKDARIQMLLRLLAEKDHEVAKTREERDTYAEGLHQLRAELFAGKMQAMTKGEAASASDLYSTH